MAGAQVRLPDEGDSLLLPAFFTAVVHIPSSVTFGDSFPPRGSLFVCVVTYSDCAPLRKNLFYFAACDAHGEALHALLPFATAQGEAFSSAYRLSLF